MACVDRLGAGLRQLAGRRFPSPLVRDATGTVRLVLKPETFEGVVDAAFNQIRQYGQTSPPVSIRLMETLAVIAEHVHRDDHRAVLLKHAKMIERGSREGISEHWDWRDIDERYRLVIAALEGGASTGRVRNSRPSGSPGAVDERGA